MQQRRLTWACIGRAEHSLKGMIAVAAGGNFAAPVTLAEFMELRDYYKCPCHSNVRHVLNRAHNELMKPLHGGSLDTCYDVSFAVDPSGLYYQLPIFIVESSNNVTNPMAGSCNQNEGRNAVLGG